MYNFAILDPRPGADNSAFLGPQSLGIEVTIPALAAGCGLGNIDPQHSGGNAGLAAIEASLTAEVPPEGAMLATVRADADSVGAMAVLAFRAEGVDLTPDVLERVRLVAEADRFAKGPYPGPRPLPTTGNPWPSTGASASESRELSAIASAVADFKLPMGERVTLMREWLTAGDEPVSYRERVEAERLDLIRALETGQIAAETANFGWCARCGMDYREGQFPALCPLCGYADTSRVGAIAVVETTHRAATMVGYSLAPIVVALNPAFRLGAGEPHRKFTVAQYQLGYVDLKASITELAVLESGWGGSPTICGSPQGVGSALTTHEVVKVVSYHLK